VGFNDRGLNGWLNKGERSFATQFLTLCYGVNVISTDIFAESPLFTEGTGFNFPPSKLKNRGACPRPMPQSRKELEDSLLARLSSEQSAPVKIIAADLGVSPSCLRYWFPDLCVLLSEQHKVAAKIRSGIH